jgi:hypothetical protein
VVAEPAEAASVRRKRQYRHGPRARGVYVRYDDGEFAVLEAAAARAGLATTAYVGEASVAAARGTTPPTTSVLYQLAEEMIAARRQVRRYGANVNQAVAALHSTGQAPDWLAAAARRCDQAVQTLDAAVAAIVRRLP